MLNPEQIKLVYGLVRKETHNLEQLIHKENAKPLKEQDIKKTDQLTEMYHQYNLIADEIQRVGM